MSGTFDYKNYHLTDIAEELDKRIHSEYYTYPEQFVEVMRKKKKQLESLAADLHEIDLVLSGDQRVEDYLAEIT